MADALCRPRNFLQGWNWPGIFYRDEILEHDGKQGLVCPLWIRGHQCPQALYGDFSLCSSQDVSPHPYKATLELGLCLPLSPACGLVSPRRGHTGGSTGWSRDPMEALGKGMWGWVPLRGGHTFLGGSMGMICSIFLWGGIGGEGSLRDPGRFLGGLEGPGDIG